MPVTIDVDIEEMKRLYIEEGKSQYQIAEEMGLSISTVRRRFSKHKICRIDDDLTGRKFGRLLVIGQFKSDKRYSRNCSWVCVCECGNEIICRHATLVSGQRKNCSKECIPWMIDYESYIGKRYERLVILGASRNSRGCKGFLCQCDCGNKTFAMLSSLNSTTKSCGCLMKELRHTVGWSGVGELSRSYYSSTRRSARRRNKEFKVSIEYLWDLYIRQQKRCALSGLLLHMEKSYTSKPKVQTASIDRIDSSIGYIEGNLQWVDKTVNSMKKDIDQERFLLVCGLIHKFDGKLRPCEAPQIPERLSSWKGCGLVSGELMGNIKQRSKERGFDYDIDAEYLWKLFLDQGMTCSLSGLGLNIHHTYQDTKKTTASVDRVDSNQGYIRGNVQWVHQDVNNMKHTLSTEEFKNLCKDIYQHSESVTI